MLDFVDSKPGNRIAVIIALGLLVVAAVAVTEYAYAAVPESSDGGALLSLGDMGALNTTAAVDNTTGTSQASTHTIISVVLIMSLVMVGLVILGWDRKKKA